MLASPPLSTSGARTLARVRLATRVLGFETFVWTNLLDEPTHDVRGLAAFTEESPWLRARKLIQASLEGADAILLSFGVTSPSGPARVRHSEQLGWLSEEVSRTNLPVFTCGERPSHPSRWQRETSRRFPELPFEDALQKCLSRYEP